MIASPAPAGGGRTILFIAWGDVHVEAVRRCLRDSRLPDHPIVLITDTDTETDVGGALLSSLRVIRHRFSLPAAKARKAEALAAVPADLGTVLFLDTDTRVLGDVSLGFEQAERHGMAIAPAPHYSLADFRDYAPVMAAEGIAPAGQLVYNSGVIFFRADDPRVRAVFARGLELIRRHGPGWGDQSPITLAMELEGFNPYTLSPSFNHRGFGELISGAVRIWHSPSPVPSGAGELDPGYLRRHDGGRLVRVMKVPEGPE